MRLVWSQIWLARVAGHERGPPLVGYGPWRLDCSVWSVRLSNRPPSRGFGGRSRSERLCGDEVVAFDVEALADVAHSCPGDAPAVGARFRSAARARVLTGLVAVHFVLLAYWLALSLLASPGGSVIASEPAVARQAGSSSGSLGMVHDPCISPRERSRSEVVPTCGNPNVGLPERILKILLRSCFVLVRAHGCWTFVQHLQKRALGKWRCLANRLPHRPSPPRQSSSRPSSRRTCIG